MHAKPVIGMGTWESTLLPRDINSDGTTDAFYDTVLNISWLANGNAGTGSGFDASFGGGRMTWPEAMAWAANLNVFGVTGWRLPMMIDIGESGCTDPTFKSGGTDCGFNVQTISADGKTVYSEWAHLYYVTLVNLAGCEASGDCARGNASTAPDYMLQNTGNFRNLVPEVYWSGLPYAPHPDFHAWSLVTAYGAQRDTGQDIDLYALAVRPGDVTIVASVPEPQALALALAALGALVVVRGRRRAA